MTLEGEFVRTTLLALLVGALVPILVQMFLTLRAVQRASLVLERRVDDTYRDVSRTLGDLGRERQAPDALSTIGAALVPAAIAAVRAFRTTEVRATNHSTANGEEKRP